MNEPLDLPTPNLPLLRKVLDHIDAHPEEWYQGYWYDTDASCGTAFCVAGHAVAMTEGVVPGYRGELKPASGDAWVDAGKRALGVTNNEAVRLFWNSNTREVIQAAAESIAERAGERL